MDAMKLLLVEDNYRMREMMKNIYSTHFDEIIECSNGVEALAVFNDFNPDWIVMDIKMEKMGGLEATEKILELHPEAKVIIVSQYNDESTIEAAIEAGAIEFVSKENLLKVIEVINKKE